VPADHPVLEAEVIRMLLGPSHDRKGVDDAAAPLRSRLGQATIRIPTFNGERGHPTLIGWQHVAGIRALAKDVGLNAYLRAHPEAVREVPVEWETILFDMDTPEDYERIKTIFDH
jgi:CTP:molybdopterin cytidylyltransferase MocA